MSDSAVTAIILLLGAFCIGMFIFLGVYGAKRKNKAANDLRSQRGWILAATVSHKSGLPVPNGASVIVGYTDSGIVFVCNGSEISVSMEKVTDIDYILKTSRSAMMRGAAHGRRVYGKTVGSAAGVASAIQYDFVISYESGGAAKRVVLDAGSGQAACAKMKEHFRSNNQGPVRKIEL